MCVLWLGFSSQKTSVGEGMIVLSDSYLLISLQHCTIPDNWYRFEHENLNAVPLPTLTQVWMPRGSKGGSGRALPLLKAGDEDYKRGQGYEKTD